MRTFFAVPIPEQFHSALQDLGQQLDRPEDFRWVEPGNYHVTLRFLGDVSRNRLEEIDGGVQRKLPTTGPLTLSLTGVGVFPEPGYPRVLWAGLDAPEPWYEVQSTLESICVDCGLEPEDRDHHPHVTLARTDVDPDRVTDQVQAWFRQNQDRELGEFEFDRIVLMESETTSNGPIYHELWEWPL